MLLTCPNCGTQYDVDSAALGPTGRTVRCEKCGHKWHAGGAQPAPAPAGSPMGSQDRPLDELRQILDNVQDPGAGQPAAAPGGAPDWAPPPQGPAYAPGSAPPPGTGWAPEAPVGHGELPPLPGATQGGAPQAAPYGAPPPQDAEDPLQRQMREHTAREDREGPSGRSKRPTKGYDRRKAMRRQQRREHQRDTSERRRRRSSFPTVLMYLVVFGGLFFCLYYFRTEIGARFPALAPYLDQYGASLDRWGTGISGYTTELWSDLFEKIDNG